MTVRETIIQILKDRFDPAVLEVRDDSHKHAGHAGARPEGETHFHVTMTTQAFNGESRFNRYRAVHNALEELLKDRVHALSMTLKGTVD